MARRSRNEEGLFEALAVRVWGSSALTGIIAFLVMHSFLPSILADNPVLADLAPLSRSFAWLPLLFFGLLALASLVRAKLTGGADSRSASRRKSHRTWRDTSVNISRLRLNHGWGITTNGMVEVAKPKESFEGWNLSALRALEWKRFELLCTKYYKAAGFRSQTLRYGADGTIDLKLFKDDPAQPVAIVQCRTWNVYSLGVKEIRELLAVMAAEKVERGILITTGTYSRDALNFAGDYPIQLLDGESFLKKIQALSEERRNRLFKYAFDGDYRTPTCASCGIKMAERKGAHGAFWGCLNSPRCGNTFAIRR